MIDITTIQANPIPLPIKELQEVNKKLVGEIEFLQKALSKNKILLGIVVVTFLGFSMYRYKQAKDANKQKQKYKKQNLL